MGYYVFFFIEKYYFECLIWGKWFVVGIDCKMVGFYNIMEFYDVLCLIDIMICC